MQRLISLMLPMTLVAWPLLVDSALKGVVLSVAVVLAVLLLRRRSASVRHAAWLTGVCGLLALPVLAACLPAWSVLPEWYALSATDDSRPTARLLVAGEAERELDVIATEHDSAVAPRRPEKVGVIKFGVTRVDTTGRVELGLKRPTDGNLFPSQAGEATEPPTKLTGTDLIPAGGLFSVWLVPAWFAGSIWMLMRLVFGQIALRRLCRGAELLDQPEWTDRLRSLCTELGIPVGGSRRAVTIWKLKTRVIPMAWGILRPRVVLPADVDEWSDERTRTVLLHELAHIRRRDCLTQWIAELARVLHWFNPLVWLAVRRMRAERERACDDLVLDCGLPATTYADQLIHMTAEYPSFRFQLPLAVAMARQSGLEHRVRRILDVRLDRRRLTRLGIGVLIAVIATVLLPLSMLDRRLDKPIEAAEATDKRGEEQASPDQTAKRQADQTSPKLRYEAQAKGGVKEIELDGRLVVETKLINDGTEPVNVYWGDYAYPAMYAFDIRHDDSRQRLPATRLPVHEQMVPRAAQRRYFRTIEPGDAITYDVYLIPVPGGNAQRVHFRRPGVHVITPTLHITTESVLDRNTGELSQLPNTWTGTLEALPFIVNVKGDPAVLADGISVNGEVTTHDGQAAAGAIIQATHRVSSFGAFDGFHEQVLDQAYADKQGRFQMVRLPGDSSAFQFKAWLPGHPLGLTELINDGKARKRAMKIALPRGLILKGRVVDDRGDPLVDVRVSSSTRTDDEGRFTLASMAAADEYNVQLWRRGYVGITTTADHETATGGDWIITLVPESAVKLKGVARFSDGSPVRNSKIEFKLTPLDATQALDERVRGVRCETKADGSFTVTLPEAIEYSGVATAFETVEFNIGRTWRYPFPKVGAATELLELTFENRNRIRLNVAHTNELPDSLRLNISCRFERRRTMEEQKIPVTTENVVFDRLAPGDYEVSVVIASAEHWNWSEAVTIPANDTPQTADVTIQIPELHFGDVVAKFVLPDGKTPLRNGRIWIDSHSGWGSVQTDEQGRVELKTLPAGRLQLTPRRVSGVAEAPVIAHVEGEKLTDLGTIQLKREDEVYGWVEGTLTYDDGTPVLGANSDGLGVGVSTATTMQPSGFRGARIGRDGRFRIQIPAGWHDVIFDLTNAAGWMGGSQNRSSFLPKFQPDGGFERLTARVGIDAGKTIQRDLVLRRTKERRKLNVKWKVPDTERVFVTTVVAADGIRLTKTVWALSEGDSGPNEPAFQLDNVPAGRCTVVLRTNGDPYFALKTVDTSQPEPTVEFDSSESSMLAVRVSGPDGKPLRGLGLNVSTRLAGQLIGVCAVSPVTGRQPVRSERKHRALRELDDGTMVVSGLGHGNYSVTVSNGDWKHEHSISLIKGAGTSIDWIVDENGQFVSRTLKPLVDDSLE